MGNRGLDEISEPLRCDEGERGSPVKRVTGVRTREKNKR